MTKTISKAKLTVTADNKSREFGDPNPTLTASFSGFKNGETFATSDVLGSPSLSTAAAATSAPRGRTIDCSSSSAPPASAAWRASSACPS